MQGSPKELASYLLSSDPLPPNTIQLTSDQDDEEDACYVFQLLSNILMEAIGYLTNDFTNLNLNEFTPDTIYNLNPYFKSMGFTIVVKEYNKNDEEYKDYYSRVILKNSEYETFFIMKNITTNFHFLLNGNGDYLNTNKTRPLDKLALIFYVNDKVFHITYHVHY